MPLSVWYWLFMALWVLSAAWGGYLQPPPARWPFWAGGLILFLLFLILGLKTMGSPVQ